MIRVIAYNAIAAERFVEDFFDKGTRYTYICTPAQLRGLSNYTVYAGYGYLDHPQFSAISDEIRRSCSKLVCLKYPPMDLKPTFTVPKYCIVCDKELTPTHSVEGCVQVIVNNCLKMHKEKQKYADEFKDHFLKTEYKAYFPTPGSDVWRNLAISLRKENSHGSALACDFVADIHQWYYANRMKSIKDISSLLKIIHKFFTREY